METNFERKVLSFFKIFYTLKISKLFFILLL